MRWKWLKAVAQSVRETGWKPMLCYLTRQPRLGRSLALPGSSPYPGPYLDFGD
jgi:hypothetical protein